MKIPTHVAIIPDGNRRWARARNLPDVEGHRVSAENVVPRLIQTLADAGVKYFTFWAMSTENAKKRSEEENDNLMGLMKFFLQRRVDDLHKKNVRIDVIGNISVFSQDIQELIAQTREKTKNNTGITVVFAVNYGGRDEMIRAIHKLASEGKAEDVTQEQFKKYLDTKDIPDPDLIIRTGGEKRLSGFMLWQSEYAEYDFSNKFFPDYTEQDCMDAITSYGNRERRYGK